MGGLCSGTNSNSKIKLSRKDKEREIIRNKNLEKNHKLKEEQKDIIEVNNRRNSIISRNLEGKIIKNKKYFN